jgi:hypothetical protein
VADDFGASKSNNIASASFRTIRRWIENPIANAASDLRENPFPEF